MTMSYCFREAHGRGTRPSGQWLKYESCGRLRSTVSFVVRRLKPREIHAPHLADRVLHRWLVPLLEALYEPVFVDHSDVNRLGEASYAEVDQMQAWMRQRNGRGWLLQLDVHNFFNSIHRPTLYALLTHSLVHRRVVAHFEQQLSCWAQRHLIGDCQPRAWFSCADPAALSRLQQILSSCWGHFAHAGTWRLRHALWRRHAWLGVLFCMDAKGCLYEHWGLQGSTFAQQVGGLRQQWPQARTVVNKGTVRLHVPHSAAGDGSRVRALQTGWLRHGTRHREIVEWHRVSAAPDALATIP